VLNAAKATQLLGIASLGDLAEGTGDEKMAGQVLEEVSKPVPCATP
jgi:hypothetical protein